MAPSMLRDSVCKKKPTPYPSLKGGELGGQQSCLFRGEEAKGSDKKMSWRYVQLIFYTPCLYTLHPTSYTLHPTNYCKKKLQNTCVYQRKSVPLQRRFCKNILKTVQKHCKNTLKHKQNYCKKGEEAIRRGGERRKARIKNTCVYQRKSVPLQRKSGQNNLFFSEKAGKMPFNSSEKANNINRTV